MAAKSESSPPGRFSANLLRPAGPGGDGAWAFVVLPKAVSELLPRRGRTTVEGTVNGHPFLATLEPDGQLSHWLKVDGELQAAAGIRPGDRVDFDIAAVAEEPEPEVPEDLQKALAGSPEARKAWEETTTIARLDWIHWMTTAKQAKSRAKRVGETGGRRLLDAGGWEEAGLLLRSLWVLQQGVQGTGGEGRS